MNDIKIENWNGHQIRFVWHNGEWWAVLADIAKPLNLQVAAVARRLRAIKSQIKKDVISSHPLLTNGGLQKMLIVNEYGTYETITQSRKKEAIEFRFWVYDVLKELRQATGLEGFQIFRMLDKEHQKEAMKKLKESLRQPTKVDYIKANVIADKAVSNIFGFPKMIKKSEMTPDMLVKRQNILEDTVELMALREKYGLNVSVAQVIYNKYKS